MGWLAHPSASRPGFILQKGGMEESGQGLALGLSLLPDTAGVTRISRNVLLISTGLGGGTGKQTGQLYEVFPAGVLEAKKQIYAHDKPVRCNVNLIWWKRPREEDICVLFPCLLPYNMLAEAALWPAQCFGAGGSPAPGSAPALLCISIQFLQHLGWAGWEIVRLF